MRRLLTAVLLPLAAAVRRRYTPTIVAVVGTVGKTGAKNMIASALGESRKVRASEKSNNTEIGAALTVIGASSPGRSIVGWVRVCKRGLGLLLTKQSYPDTLVLEFGEQRPGDLTDLARLFPPNVVVVTTIGATHAVWFGGVEGVVKEFRAFLGSLDKKAIVILNADDVRVTSLESAAPGRVVSYGIDNDADVRVRHIEPRVGRDDKRGLFVDGIRVLIERKGEASDVFVPGAIGRPAAAAAAAAFAVGSVLDVPSSSLVAGCARVTFEKGRLRVIDGIKFASIIDDTYNASTASMIEALKALRSIPIDEGEKRIAVLGDMREMGAHAEEEHQKVGRAVAAEAVDTLITVGELSRDIARGALAAGFPRDHAFHFATTEQAGKFVQGIMARGDIILVKASRGMHLEAVVKELMAEPLEAEQLLEWGEPNT